MKAVVAAFNQEKALVGAFSVITNLRMELFEALLWMYNRVSILRLSRENAAEDERCLAMAEDAIVSGGEAGCPVTGVIVEPIQAEGGDHHGSNRWPGLIITSSL